MKRIKVKVKANCVSLMGKGSYRIHKSGYKTTGRPVSGWMSRKAAIQYAKSLAIKTGDRYIIMKGMHIVERK